MPRSKAIEALVKDGFDRAFAEKAVEWFTANRFDRIIKPSSFVRFINHNEYGIRTARCN